MALILKPEDDPEFRNEWDSLTPYDRSVLARRSVQLRIPLRDIIAAEHYMRLGLSCFTACHAAAYSRTRRNKRPGVTIPRHEMLEDRAALFQIATHIRTLQAAILEHDRKLAGAVKAP